MALTPGTRLGVYRGHRPDRRRRHGRGVSRARHEAQSRRRDQGPARRVRERPRTPRAVQARSRRPSRRSIIPTSPRSTASRKSGRAGCTALVMELVEGPTIWRTGSRAGRPCPSTKRLPIAKQIAEALEAAHEQGIIHRDLKPANIKVRAGRHGEGAGLRAGEGAGARRPAVGPRTDGRSANSPTITSPAMMTGVGLILGTAAYMTPEQAKGRAADKRSDVWAFGCVLYEMLTGKRAFEGEDVTDTLAAVLRGEPDWTRCRPTVPPGFALCLQRCLEKDREAARSPTSRRALPARRASARAGTAPTSRHPRAARAAATAADAPLPSRSLAVRSSAPPCGRSGRPHPRRR